MTTRLRRCEKMIFTEQSIFMDSYTPQTFELKEYNNIPSPPVIRKRELKHKHKNIEFLLTYKNHVPFDLMWPARPKEIIRTSPHDLQPRFEKLIDEDRSLAQRTRRRSSIPPQVKVDDIDPEMRSIIMNETYTTTSARAYAGQTETTDGVKSPCRDQPAPANSVFLPLMQPSYVSPEWRRETVTWDKLQTRPYIDTEKEFWHKFHLYKPSICAACEQSREVTKLRKMGVLL